MAFPFSQGWNSSHTHVGARHHRVKSLDLNQIRRISLPIREKHVPESFDHVLHDVFGHLFLITRVGNDEGIDMWAREHLNLEQVSHLAFTYDSNQTICTLRDYSEISEISTYSYLKQTVMRHRADTPDGVGPLGGELFFDRVFRKSGRAGRIRS